MNLERLLAENMIRFGTRNLTENQIKQILKEQLSVSAGSPTSAVPVVNQFVNDSTLWGPQFTATYNTVKAVLSRNQVPFSVGIDLAAAWLTMARYLEGIDKTKFKAAFKSLQSFVQFIENLGALDANSFTSVEIQLNESTNEKGKVLTSGVITKTSVTGNQPGESSDINDIVQFCNDYNLQVTAKCITNTGIFIDGTISIDPYTPGGGYSIASGAKGEIKGGTFVQGMPGRVAGAGSLNLVNNGGEFYIYSLTKYIAASAGSTGKQLTTIVITPGPVVPIDATDAFEILQIQLSQTGTEEIKTALTGLQSIGKITDIRIESAASYDEEVTLNNAEFAKKVGLQPNQVPADPTKDAQGVVKDPMSGGNAFLAYMRGEALKNLVTQLIPGITPTVTAEVKIGGAKARYAKVFVTVQKPDGSTEVTTDDLKTIGVGSKTVSGAGTFKIYKYQPTF